jgi:hypothetical protein
MRAAPLPAIVLPQGESKQGSAASHRNGRAANVIRTAARVIKLRRDLSFSSIPVRCPRGIGHRPNSSMNNRFFLVLAVPLALLAGCTSYYRNVEACKDKVRADYPDAASAPLKLTGSGASYHGSRVVVRGVIPTDPKPPATKKVDVPAAAECTFSENTPTGFQWLAPPRLKPKPQPAED